jgi:hypothetical protein
MVGQPDPSSLSPEMRAEPTLHNRCRFDTKMSDVHQFTHVPEAIEHPGAPLPCNGGGSRPSERMSGVLRFPRFALMHSVGGETGFDRAFGRSRSTRPSEYFHQGV